MARSSPLYSSVMRKINADAWFTGLSKLAQLVWLRLLTGKHITSVAGLWPVHEEGLASDFGFRLWDFHTLLLEITEEPDGDGFRRLYIDNVSGVLWIPKSISQPCNQPANEKVLLGWVPHLEMVPECELKWRSIYVFRKWISGNPNRFPNGIPNRFPNGIGDGSDIFARAPERVPERVRPRPHERVPERVRGRVRPRPPASARDSNVEPMDITGVSEETGRNGIVDGLQPVSPQDQDQEQKGSVAPARAYAPERDPTPEPVPKPVQRPKNKTSLTPVERCERTFTQIDPNALKLFETWKRESGKKNAGLDWKRRELFERLAFDCVSEQTVTLVTRGAKRDKWATEQVNLDPAAILGSVGQREKFMALEQAASAEDTRIKNRYAPAAPERPIAPENRVTAAELEQGLAEVERRTRGGVRRARGPETLAPIPLIPSIAEKSEDERKADHARRASEARIALAKLDAEGSDDQLPPALEA